MEYFVALLIYLSGLLFGDVVEAVGSVRHHLVPHPLEVEFLVVEL